MKSLFHDKIKLLLLYIIALAGSAFSVFYIPEITQRFPRIKHLPIEIFLMLLIFVVVKIIVTGVLICRENSSQTKSISVTKALLQAAALEGVLALAEIVFFVVAGIVARVCYHTPFFSADYTNFKIGFTVIIVIILVLLLPNYLSLFWSVVENPDKKFAKYKSGLVMSINNYSMLLFVVLMLFVSVYIIRSIFLLVPTGTVSDIIKMFLLSLVSLGVLSMTYSICVKNKHNSGKTE